MRPGDPFGGVLIDDFRAQMLWLKRRCDLIAPEQYLEAVRNPTARRARVLVTFDDGYRGFYENAYPVLQELQIPSLVFLVTAFVGTDRLLWTYAVAWAFLRTRRAEVEAPWGSGERWGLTDALTRRQAYEAAKEHLKGIGEAERKELQSRLLHALDVDPDDGSAGRQMLSWEEARRTLEYTRYGGHSHTHPVLSQILPSEVDTEVRLCRETIERELGKAPDYFAYPNGRLRDFNECVKKSLQRHGFELAFSTIPGVNGPDTDRYAIRRQPTGCASIADFAWLVAGH